MVFIRSHFDSFVLHSRVLGLARSIGSCHEDEFRVSHKYMVVVSAIKESEDSIARQEFTFYLSSKFEELRGAARHLVCSASQIWSAEFGQLRLVKPLGV